MRSLSTYYVHLWQLSQPAQTEDTVLASYTSARLPLADSQKNHCTCAWAASFPCQTQRRPQSTRREERQAQHQE